jgi:hypothetical protein
MWKQFWFRKQKYHTFCLPCISAEKERERSIKKEKDPDRDWGAIMLQDASKSMISAWHENAKQNLFGKDGKSRGIAYVEVSDDDEEEDITFKWIEDNIALSKASSTVATLWLRTARARLQARSNT